MSVRLNDFDLLVADSSVLFRFFEAGAESTRLMMNHCAERLYIVHDVYEEIERYQADPSMRAGIEVFNAMLKTEVVQLPHDLTEQVADILKLNKKYGLGDEDEGETATVLYAERAWEEDETEFLVLMSDRGGGYLAEDRDVPVMKADEMVLDLVCCKAMTAEEGEVVWREIFKKHPDIEGYYAKIEKRCQ